MCPLCLCHHVCTFSLCETFKCVQLNFVVNGCKQATIHTCAHCNLTSVGLAQAPPSVLGLARVLKNVH